jgi:hypothetical protein
LFFSFLTLHSSSLLFFLVACPYFTIFLFVFRNFPFWEFSEISIILLKLLQMLEITCRDILRQSRTLRLFFPAYTLSKDALGAEALLCLLHAVFVFAAIHCRWSEWLWILHLIFLLKAFHLVFFLPFLILFTHRKFFIYKRKKELEIIQRK